MYMIKILKISRLEFCRLILREAQLRMRLAEYGSSYDAAEPLPGCWCRGRAIWGLAGGCCNRREQTCAPMGSNDSLYDFLYDSLNGSLNDPSQWR